LYCSRYSLLWCYFKFPCYSFLLWSKRLQPTGFKLLIIISRNYGKARMIYDFRKITNNLDKIREVCNLKAERLKKVSALKGVEHNKTW
jgi:hypothetical protein